ncbi:MAG: metal-dependent hydrolase [Tissierellia bacterium]|nr:metal-dependent hydrolase [Tissierellia bacterium]
MLIEYIGHSTFVIDTQDKKIIIDPFILGNPWTETTLEDYSEITHIFITHGHADHLGDGVELAKGTGALVYCNHEIAAYLKDQGVDNIHGMHIGGRHGWVKMTPALHGSGIETPQGMLYGGLAGGFLLDIEGKRIYHSGDTGLSQEMKLLEGLVDLAMIPVGGNYTMDIEDAKIALDFIQPGAFIPMHYKTFPVIDVEPENLIVEGIQGIYLRPGEKLQW